MGIQKTENKNIREKNKRRKDIVKEDIKNWLKNGTTVWTTFRYNFFSKAETPTTLKKGVCNV